MIGFLTSLGVDKVPAAAAKKPFRLNIVGDLWAQIEKMRKDRALFLAVLGNTYFWFLGSLLFSTIVVYGPDVLHIGQTKTGYSERDAGSGHRAWQHGGRMGQRQQDRVWADSAGIDRHDVHGVGARYHAARDGGIGGAARNAGFLGGLLRRAGECAHPAQASGEDKGGIIAAANLLSFAGIAISSGVYFVFTAYIHLDPRGVIVAASCITAFSTAYVLYLLPEWFGRLILFFATRTVYRVRVIGRDNFPEKTGALLVCNHMSFVDVALLVAATDRPIRFIMYQGIYDHPVSQAVRQNGEGNSDIERAAPA